MKKILRLFCIVVITISCTNGYSDQEIGNSDSFNMVISRFVYNSDFRTEYRLTASKLMVVNISQDSLLFSSNISDSDSIKVISEFDLSGYERHYGNPCLLDGLQLEIFYTGINGSDTVRVNNYYLFELGYAIDYINKRLNKKLKIPYDKELLESMVADCINKE